MEIPSKVMRTRTLLAALIAVSFFTLNAWASQHNMPSTPSSAVTAVARQRIPIAEYYPLAEYHNGLAAFDHAKSPQERANGLMWIQRAADQNLAMAQEVLGEIYLHGRGVPQNTAMALKWLRKAAERGGPAAQLQLGSLYEAGDVIPENDARAYYWFAIAAKPVHSDFNIYNIAQMRAIAKKHLAAVSAALTPAQRETIDQEVATWEPKPSVAFNAVAPTTSEPSSTSDTTIPLNWVPIIIGKMAGLQAAEQQKEWHGKPAPSFSGAFRDLPSALTVTHLRVPNSFWVAKLDTMMSVAQRLKAENKKIDPSGLKLQTTLKFNFNSERVYVYGNAGKLTYTCEGKGALNIDDLSRALKSPRLLLKGMDLDQRMQYLHLTGALTPRILAQPGVTLLEYWSPACPDCFAERDALLKFVRRHPHSLERWITVDTSLRQMSSAKLKDSRHPVRSKL